MSDAFRSRIAQLSAQQLQLLALDLRARLDRIQAERKEPIAVVGMSCRFPGGENPDAFWTLISQGQDAIREIPSERWPIDAYYDPDPDARGKMATRWGGFLERVREFDAEFFGISPREAMGMDPQQRLLLEVTWEALENAGIAPDSLRGTRAGVFVGICSSDYFQLSVARGFETFDTYLATGGSGSVASGRLSYVLGLEGPAVTLDTACSSSLTAVHLAVRSLRNGECRLAVAGGANVLAWPGGTIALSRGRMMAADGRCKAFDARGDGFVRSEGCGIVALKRLSDAVADGDTVLALIRGSAINQDGRSNGLTAPNGRAQTSVVTDALEDAGVAPASISYVEAHGTGTPLGDPIELHALGAALSPNRATDDPVLVGSVKTNIGHPEAAAGVAGLIKTILMLRHGQIAPSLHFTEPNPFIEWDRIPVRVASALTKWEPRSGRRLAGVSAFGFSGSNAHIVLEEAPPTPAGAPADASARELHLLPLSARSESALRTLAERYERAIADDPAAAIADVCYTAGVGRARLEYRAAIVARTRDEVREQLRALATDDPASNAIRGQVASTEAPKVAFLYTGHGSQYVGMGASLLRTEPVFREALERCAAVLDPILAFPLLATIYSADQNDRRIHDFAFTQPATLAVQYALTELWRSWGVVPSAVMGHSLGEFGAAWAAGVMSIEDALRLVAERSRLMKAAPEGSMVAVFANAASIAHQLAANPRVSVGAFNGPDNTVLSGPRADVDQVAAAITAMGIEVRALEIGVASHSSLMEPVLDEFERAVSRAQLRSPERLLISNLSGKAAGSEIAAASYWRRHMREPVRFGDGMASLLSSGVRLFLEIGPHPSLVSMARRSNTGEGLQWLPSLRRDTDAVEQMTATLGALYAHGVQVDFKGFSRGSTRKVFLPTYPFERESFWMDPAGSPSSAHAQAPASGLPGRRIDVARGPVVFEGSMSRAEQPWLDSHRVNGRMVAPGPLFVDMARAAARVAFEIDGGDVVDLQISAPLVVDDADARRVHTLLEQLPDGRIEAEIFGQNAEGSWTLHATCAVVPFASPAEQPSASHSLGSRENAIDVEGHYAKIRELGVAFGPELRRLTSLAAVGEEASGSVSILEQAGLSGPVHAAVVDGVLHVVGACLLRDPDPHLMVGAERVFVSPDVARGGSLQVYARLRPSMPGDDGDRLADAWAQDSTGRVIVAVTGARLRRARTLANAQAGRGGPDQWLYDVRWNEAPPLSDARISSNEHWLLVGAASTLRSGLSDLLRDAGARASIIDVADGDSSAPLEARVGAALDAVVGFGPPTKVVVLEAVRSPSSGESAALSSRLEDTCRTALAMCREMIARDWSGALWFVGSGASEATGAANVAAGALFGFGRSVANEQPKLWGGLIDVDQTAAVDGAARVVAEILAPRAETEVALVGERRLVARLARVDQSTPVASLELRSDATYVVTGALGGIGLKLLSRLAERGAKHIAVFARRAPGAAEQSVIDAVQRAGAAVHLVRADVAIEEDVARGLETVRRECPPIAGVFHVAGIYNDSVIERMDWARFASVLAPKTLGAWHLHRHTLNDALEHFVMFASGASLLGPVGLSNYAAANAGLDTLAHLRHSMGRPAVSVDWGPWADTGMAAAVGTGRHGQWTHAGFSPMTPVEAFGLLETLMVRGTPVQAAAMPVDWSVFRASQTGTHILYSGFGSAAPSRREESRGSRPAPPSAAAVTAASLDALPPEERLTRLTDYLRSEVARELGVRTERIAIAKPLNALGFDSLMAVQLRNRMQESLQITIPVSQFIDGSSVQQIAADFAQRLQASAVTAPREQSAVSQIDVGALSDSDVDRMLRELLAE